MKTRRGWLSWDAPWDLKATTTFLTRSHEHLFNETIVAGIRAIDQSFGVDHFNDLWSAEDEKLEKELLWGLPEDDSKTNSDSEAEVGRRA